jgi:hypothetical protein
VANGAAVSWVWIGGAVVVLPVVIGIVVLALARRAPSLGSRPLVTAAALYVLLLVVVALATPGGDLVTPTLAATSSMAVAVAVYVRLRRALAV